MSATPVSRFVSLASTLAFSEFKLRYAGSALGYVWSLSKPLMLFGVMYVVFARVLRFGEGIPNYPLQLLLAIVLWTFFAEVTSSSVTVLVARADMLRKVAFPRIVLPVAVSLNAVLALLLNLVAILIFIVASGVEPDASWLLFPVLLVELYLLALAVGLVLSSLYVGFRDIGQLWEVGLQVLFYATPIIYPLSMVPTAYQQWSLLNPLAQIIHQARLALIVSDETPGVVSVGASDVVAPLALVAVLLVLGGLCYNKMGPRIAERV